MMMMKIDREREKTPSEHAEVEMTVAVNGPVWRAHNVLQVKE